MKKRDFTIGVCFVGGIVLSLGYSVIAYMFMTKTLAFTDVEKPNFPLIVSSDILVFIIAIIIASALAWGSCHIIPNYLAEYYYVSYKDYMERRESYLAQNEQSNNSKTPQDSSDNSNKNNGFEEMKNNVRSFLDHKRK